MRIIATSHCTVQSGIILISLLVRQITWLILLAHLFPATVFSETCNLVGGKRICKCDVSTRFILSDLI